jgi:hypothetical protein
MWAAQLQSHENRFIPSSEDRGPKEVLLCQVLDAGDLIEGGISIMAI